MRGPVILVGALVIAGIVVAISNGVRDTPNDGSSRRDTCVAVPRSTVKAIEEGLTVRGALVIARAAKAGEWWYVAAEIDGPGLKGSGDVGVWAMPDYLEPGPIIMAEGFAREFTQWGTQAGAENFGVWRHPAVREAAGCLYL